MCNPYIDSATILSDRYVVFYIISMYVCACVYKSICKIMNQYDKLILYTQCLCLLKL